MLSAECWYWGKSFSETETRCNLQFSLFWHHTNLMIGFIIFFVVKWAFVVFLNYKSEPMSALVIHRKKNTDLSLFTLFVDITSGTANKCNKITCCFHCCIYYYYHYFYTKYACNTWDRSVRFRKNTHSQIVHNMLSNINKSVKANCLSLIVRQLCWCIMCWTFLGRCWKLFFVQTHSDQL